jgi:hypothetical protein
VKLAIVGSEERTRDLAPWNDPDYHIWVLNEYTMAPWCKRWDGAIQLHPKSVYQSPYNDKDPHYWEWLQQKHNGLIFMQEIDPLVPNSIRYPLDAINKKYLSNLTFEDMAVKSFDASICYAVALGTYLDYERIDIYGVELVYDLHYRAQQTNFAFWIGIASQHTKIDLHCSEGLFNKPLYGYEVYMEYEGKLENYLRGMNEQLENTKTQLHQIEGAIAFAKQLLEEEQKEKEDGKNKPEVGNKEVAGQTDIPKG